MTDLRKAAEQALEALKNCRYRSLADEIVDPAITALKEALAQPEQEQEPSVEQINLAVEAWFENFKNRSYQERMQHAFKAAHGIKEQA